MQPQGSLDDLRILGVLYVSLQIYHKTSVEDTTTAVVPDSCMVYQACGVRLWHSLWGRCDAVLKYPLLLISNTKLLTCSYSNYTRYVSWDDFLQRAFLMTDITTLYDFDLQPSLCPAASSKGKVFQRAVRLLHGGEKGGKRGILDVV